MQDIMVVIRGLAILVCLLAIAAAASAVMGSYALPLWIKTGLVVGGGILWLVALKIAEGE